MIAAPLPAPLKTELLAALRSGEYVQGHGILHGDGCFCVMGVMADLALKHGVKGRWKDMGEGVSALAGGGDPDGLVLDVLPLRFADFYGQEKRGQRFAITPGSLPADLVAELDDATEGRLMLRRRLAAEVTLMDLNDHGASFELIAGVIEAAL